MSPSCCQVYKAKVCTLHVPWHITSSYCKLGSTYLKYNKSILVITKVITMYSQDQIEKWRID